MPAANPAPAADRVALPVAKKAASAHHPAAAASLIGHITANVIVGLAASVKAAKAPAVGPHIRRARPADARTATMPNNGTTQKTAVAPARSWNAAITIGSPAG